MGVLETRNFPDGETYIRFRTDPAGRKAILVCTLNRPDEKFLPLSFAASTARDLGAQSLGLVAPYLGYMRQDKVFLEGEALTSTYFARQLSSAFDWLVTIDPHLHRHHALDEIYSIPTRVGHSAALIGEWIGRNVASPVLIGPDVESEQWVADVASLVAAPHYVLQKERKGDRDVRISIPDLKDCAGLTPVLLDDIVSSGRTMIEATRQLRGAGLPAPVCIGVHALFSDAAYADLVAVAARVVTTNAVPHRSNGIEVARLVAALAQDIIDSSTSAAAG